MRGLRAGEDEGRRCQDRNPHQRQLQRPEGGRETGDLRPGGPEPEQSEGEPSEGQPAAAGAIERIRRERAVSLPPQPVLHKHLVELVGGHAAALQEAEKQEFRRLAVPQANQEERHEQREHAEIGGPPGCPDPRDARHHQRVIDVGAQPAGQRHVPAAPEADEILRREGPVEILRQRDAEEPRHPDHHVDVAGEIAINVQRVDRDDRCAGADMSGHGRVGTQAVDRSMLRLREQHRDDGDLEIPDDDALHGGASYGEVERQWLDLDAAIVLIALDWTRGQAGEVERVIDVGQQADASPQCPLMAVDDQMQHTKEHVGQSDQQVGEGEQCGAWEEAVAFEPKERGQSQQQRHRKDPRR